MTTQIAVGDDADHMAVAVGDADAAKTLRRHFHQRIGHLGAERLERHGVARMHEVAGVFQHRTQLAARMQHAEIHRGEAAPFQERDRQRIAHRQHHQRRGRGSEIVRTGLARLRQRQRDIGGLGQRRGGLGGDRDHADPEALGIGNEVFHLRLLAGPRQGHDDIVGRDHAEIAMAGLCGMDEESWCSRRGEGRGDLAADMAGLAEACDDQAAPSLEDQVGGGNESRAEIGLQRGGQRGDAAGFGLQRTECRGNRFNGLIAHRCRRFRRKAGCLGEGHQSHPGAGNCPAVSPSS